jgi:conjugal transfer pilus assembly protein TraW
MKAKLLALLTLCFSASALAEELGTIGNVYPIGERNFLSFIERKLSELEKSGSMAEYQEKMTNQARQSFFNPNPTNLPFAEKNRFVYFDPSVLINEDIRDEQGKILYPNGTKVNALEHMALTSVILFFNGESEDEIAWAKAIHDSKKAIPILTAGKWADLSLAWNRQVYFDQKGLLTKRFMIDETPAMIEAVGRKLKISYFAIPRK